MESMQRAAAPTEQAARVPKERWIALLGRRDAPTDGIEDYCSFLGEALAPHNIDLHQERVGWAEKGWLGGLRSLWMESANWGKGWVLLQYATMAWSRRGFPFGAWVALRILRRRGLRCAVVFHEPFRQNGERWIDALRGSCQDWVIQQLYASATEVVFLDPLEKIRWLPDGTSKAHFIPIGANIPERLPESATQGTRSGNEKTVAVFCLSDPPNRDRELGDIAHAMRFVTQQGHEDSGGLPRQGTPEAKEEIEKMFDSSARRGRELWFAERE